MLESIGETTIKGRNLLPQELAGIVMGSADPKAAFRELGLKRRFATGSEFKGREMEISQIEQTTGRGGILLLRAEPRSGKTSLLKHLEGEISSLPERRAVYLDASSFNPEWSAEDTHLKMGRAISSREVNGGAG